MVCVISTSDMNIISDLCTISFLIEDKSQVQKQH